MQQLLLAKFQQAQIKYRHIRFLLTCFDIRHHCDLRALNFAKLRDPQFLRVYKFILIEEAVLPYAKL